MVGTLKVYTLRNAKQKKSHVVAEAVTVLRALKEELSEEEYKMVIRLADKSEEQVKDEAERAREMLKKLLGL